MSNKSKTRTEERELSAIGRLYIHDVVDKVKKGEEIDYKELTGAMDMIANSELVWGMLSAIDLGVSKNLITEENAFKLIDEIKEQDEILRCVDKMIEDLKYINKGVAL